MLGFMSSCCTETVREEDGLFIGASTRKNTGGIDFADENLSQNDD